MSKNPTRAARKATHMHTKHTHAEILSMSACVPRRTRRRHIQSCAQIPRIQQAFSCRIKPDRPNSQIESLTKRSCLPRASSNNRQRPGLRLSKNIFQAELNQSRGYRRTRDFAEGRAGRHRHARIGELRMVKRIVEFRTELEPSVFTDATHPRRFAQGDIPVELARPGDDAHSSIAISGGISHDRGSADDRCTFVDPAI